MLTCRKLKSCEKIKLEALRCSGSSEMYVIVFRNPNQSVRLTAILSHCIGCWFQLDCTWLIINTHYPVSILRRKRVEKRKNISTVVEKASKFWGSTSIQRRINVDISMVFYSASKKRWKTTSKYRRRFNVFWLCPLGTSSRQVISLFLVHCYVTSTSIIIN